MRILTDGKEIQLTYCEKHSQWWVNNCPDCMADDTESETLKQVGEWLYRKYYLGWIAHNEMPCPNPEVFDLIFYGGDLELLKSGKKPWEEKHGT